jgi:hypothetical protein
MTVDDSMAKAKMTYAIDYFIDKLVKYGQISNKNKMTCVENIKKLFGKNLAESQIPFVMIDISKQQFMDKDISNSNLLIQERLAGYDIDVLGKTLSEIVNTPELAGKTYPGSSVSAGEYADALIKLTYTRLILGQTLPTQPYQLNTELDSPTFIHPVFGQVTNGIIVQTGVSIRAKSTFIYYRTKKNTIRIMHLFHLIF